METMGISKSKVIEVSTIFYLNLNSSNLVPLSIWMYRSPNFSPIIGRSSVHSDSVWIRPTFLQSTRKFIIYELYGVIVLIIASLVITSVITQIISDYRFIGFGWKLMITSFFEFFGALQSAYHIRPIFCNWSLIGFYNLRQCDVHHVTVRFQYDYLMGYAIVNMKYVLIRLYRSTPCMDR